MTEYHVIIPKESYSILEFRQNSLPGIAVVNTALRDFEPRVVFAWHLSLLLSLEDLIENGMPSRQEREVIDRFGDVLDSSIKGDDPDKPNALFLARITWNATRELIWRVFDPEAANGYLRSIIDANFAPRHFDYRMEHDADWRMAEWHLAKHDKPL